MEYLLSLAINWVGPAQYQTNKAYLKAYLIMLLH